MAGPGFTGEACEPQLRVQHALHALHARIEAGGPFAARSTRRLFDARKPGL